MAGPKLYGWEPDRNMNDYERGIREKVWTADILTAGEWVYLVGCLCDVRDKQSSVTKNES